MIGGAFPRGTGARTPQGRIERLTGADGGSLVRVGMKRVFTHGTGAIELSPGEFVEKLAALIPSRSSAGHGPAPCLTVGTMQSCCVRSGGWSCAAWLTGR